MGEGETTERPGTIRRHDHGFEQNREPPPVDGMNHVRAKQTRLSVPKPFKERTNVMHGWPMQATSIGQRASEPSKPRTTLDLGRGDSHGERKEEGPRPQAFEHARRFAPGTRERHELETGRRVDERTAIGR